MPIYSETVTHLSSANQPYLRLDGAQSDADYVDIGVADSLGVKYSSYYSIDGWIYVYNSNTANTIFSDANGDNTYIRLQIFAEGSDDGKLRFAGHTQVPNQYNWTIQSSNNAIVSNKWYHVCAVLDRKVSANCKIYINGVDKTETQTLGSSADLPYHAFGNFDIGRRGYNNDMHFGGMIRSLRCWNIALSSSEVIDLYNGSPVSYKHRGGSQVQRITTAADSDFSGSGNWTSLGNHSHSIGSGIMTVVASGATNGSSNAAILNATNTAESGGVAGKAYNWEFRAKASSGTPALQVRTPWEWSGGNTQNFTLSTTWQTFTIQNKVKTILENAYFGLMEAGTFYIDDVYMTQAGVVGEWDGSGLASDKWFDKSGNDNHGLLKQGASAENIPSGDDGLIYEEGSWTPTLEDPDGDEPTYFTHSGSYTRVGRLVTFQGVFYINSNSGMSGIIEIKGLPYTSVNQTAVTFGELRQTDRGGSGNLTFLASVVANTTTISMVINNGDGKANSNALQHTAIGYATQWFFGGTYEI